MARCLRSSMSAYKSIAQNVLKLKGQITPKMNNNKNTEETREDVVLTPTKEDIEHFERVLLDYKYYSDIYTRLAGEYYRLSNELQEECGHIKGVSFDREPSGNNTPVRVTPYINELILREATAEAELKRIQQKMDWFDEENKIFERLSTLNTKERQLIELRYFEGYTLKQIRSLIYSNDNKQTYDESYMRRKIRKALISMLVADV